MTDRQAAFCEVASSQWHSETPSAPVAAAVYLGEREKKLNETLEPRG